MVELPRIRFVTTLKDCSRLTTYLRPSNEFQVYFLFFQLDKKKKTKQNQNHVGLQKETVSAGINAASTIENNSIRDQHYLVSEPAHLKYFQADIFSRLCLIRNGREKLKLSCQGFQREEQKYNGYKGCGQFGAS